MESEGLMKSEAFSILGANGRDYEKEESKSFHRDLNLLQIFDRLTAKWGKDVRKYYLCLPESASEEDFRRAVYGDIKREPVYRALIAFTNNLTATEEIRREKEHVSDPVQKAVWMVREEAAYRNAYETLARELSEATVSSEGMKEFLRILSEILNSEQYRVRKEQTDRILGEIKQLRFLITYDRERIAVKFGEISGPGAYEQWLNGVCGGESAQLQNPFAAEVPVTDFERACLEILEKKKPEFFRALKELSEQPESGERPVLKRFEKEILFYLSFGSLQKELSEAGFAFCTPERSDGRIMEAKGLYDLALAILSRGTGRKIIANDFRYEDGDRFFVLTGPNQGGKTTFARSLGQLVYFSRMGLDVPAESALVPFFPDIQTHFSVEESVQTGRGKLMEELVRLAPMMKERKKDTFVIINELFTTAANYDAQIMGKRVLKHFVGLGCRGIYVTHLTDLTDACEGVEGLRAVADENGIPTFQIVRGKAEDVVCAAHLVNRYRLTYEQLKERL